MSVKIMQKVLQAFLLKSLPSPRSLLPKLKVAQAVLKIRNSRKKRFGLFVIFGWRQAWNLQYADIPDSTQDIFAHHERNIFKPESVGKIAKTTNFDGAILIDKSGTILHSGIIIEGLRPRRLAARVWTGKKDADLSAKLGFRTKVHSRHLSAISSSWELKGTTVYTVSEETGDVHIFENGRIIYSTVRGENV